MEKDNHKLSNNNVSLGSKAGLSKEPACKPINGAALGSKAGIYRCKGKSMTIGYLAETIVISDSLEPAFELIKKEADNIGLKKKL